MKKLLLLTGCTKPTETPTSQVIKDITQEVTKNPTEKDNTQEPSSNGSADNNPDQSIVSYEIPELNLSFEIDKRYAEDLVYEYRAQYNSVAFDSRLLNSKYPLCGLGHSGCISEISASEDCISSEKIPFTHDGKAYCFSGPQALCAPSVELEEAYSVVSTPVVYQAMFESLNSL